MLLSDIDTLTQGERVCARFIMCSLYSVEDNPFIALLVQQALDRRRWPLDECLLLTNMLIKGFAVGQLTPIQALQSFQANGM